MTEKSLPSSPTSEGREELPHDLDKALALLASIESPCDDVCEHSWRRCRHCLAVEELGHERKIVGLLRRALQDAAAELTHLRAEHERLIASHEALVKSRDEDRAEAAALRAESERLKADRDSWRRCADARESERLEVVAEVQRLNAEHEQMSAYIQEKIAQQYIRPDGAQ